jgi:RNA polymerase sigma-70 factor (ECF subfamily)
VTDPHGAVRATLSLASASERARIVSTLIRVTGDWDLAEDCTQDAFASAIEDWPRRGIPSNPGAWLTTVAKNRAIDRLRRAATETTALRELALSPDASPDQPPEPAVEDDRLRLIFTCCHPALEMDARVALTLRTVAGLSTEEIARAFLVPEPTLAKRLVRARAKIRNAGIPYRVPPAKLLPERTAGVLAVLYLLFNEGYSATGGDALVREPLVTEAIRLARLVVGLLDALPDGGQQSSEARGLLALMLFHHARAASRTDANGDLVTRERQDRSNWNRHDIADGVETLRRVQRDHQPGPYELQAEIARCHVEAPDVAATDFARVAQLYATLALIAPSPVVELNRAVAIAMSQGPEAGLAIIDAISSDRLLDGYYLLPAARADLLRRLGRRSEASTEYRHARDLAPSEVERRYLNRRLIETGGKQ